MNRRRIYSTIITLAFVAGVAVMAHAQVNQVWVTRYLASVASDANVMVVDASGNVYVTGASINSPYNGFDYCTIKYDSAGVQQWETPYDGPAHGEDKAHAMAVDGNGNVYVTGGSEGIGTSTDFCTIKYNSQGVQQWVARYDGSAHGGDVAYALAVDGAGNVYVTGNVVDTVNFSDYCTIKYNSAGAQQWVAIYDGPDHWNDYPCAIALDNNENVIVTGSSMGAGAVNWYDYCTIQYDNNGNQIWVARYNGPGNYGDNPRAMAVDGDGNIYVTGQSLGATTGWDYCTIKYSSSGVQDWVARYDAGSSSGSLQDEALAIAVGGGGSVYVTGRSQTEGNNNDYCTIKYDDSGEQQWVTIYNGPGNGDDFARSLALDAAGNVYITGNSYGTGNDDYCTIKYNNAGALQWLIRYNGPVNGSDVAYALGLDNYGNVIVTGQSTGTLMEYEYTTIKYSQTPSAVNPSGPTQQPSAFALYPPHPNPFNASTAISYELRVPSQVSLRVYDTTGKLVATLDDGWRQAGTHEVSFDGGRLASGIYLAKLEAGEYTSTQKLVLLK